MKNMTLKPPIPPYEFPFLKEDESLSNFEGCDAQAKIEKIYLESIIERWIIPWFESYV